MKLKFSLAAALLHFSSFAAGSATLSPRVFRDGCDGSMLQSAEQSALPSAAKILAQARIMTVDEHTVLIGGCWDYINEVWKRAGFPSEKRRIVFKSRKRGPFAQAGLIQPGDWLYFVNHSYGDIEHSALFVGWADKERLQAYMLSYAGQQRAETARYKLYDLSGVYWIIRAKG